MNVDELSINSVSAVSEENNDNQVKENAEAYAIPNESSCSPEFSEGCILEE